LYHDRVGQCAITLNEIRSPSWSHSTIMIKVERLSCISIGENLNTSRDLQTSGLSLIGFFLLGYGFAFGFMSTEQDGPFRHNIGTDGSLLIVGQRKPLPTLESADGHLVIGDASIKPKKKATQSDVMEPMVDMVLPNILSFEMDLQTQSPLTDQNGDLDKLVGEYILGIRASHLPTVRKDFCEKPMFRLMLTAWSRVLCLRSQAARMYTCTLLCSDLVTRDRSSYP
ncbi:hypothetical protein HAX54_003016, partial [Datura stramonium]|nr:hypothetical protein [Datura stramonium]